jgi:hypothetical protein
MRGPIEESLIKFEIVGFGYSEFTTANFEKALNETVNASLERMRKDLRDDGWTISVLMNWTGKLSRMEMTAIWAECHGYGR